MERQRLRRGALFTSFALFQAFKVFHLFFSPVLLLMASAAGVAGGTVIVYASLASCSSSAISSSSRAWRWPSAAGGRATRSAGSRRC
jgi:hypothetical protein